MKPRILLLIMAALLAPARSHAHSMNQSAVMLDISDGAVDAELQLPAKRFDAALGLKTNAPGIEQNRTLIESYILQRFTARAADERGFSARVASPVQLQIVDGESYVVAHLTMLPPPGADLDRFDLEDTILLDRIPSQVTLVSIRSDWRTGVFANDPHLLGVVNNADRILSVNRTGESWTSGFRPIFQLGVRHIAEGTDHLLFLLALLLPAPLLIRGSQWGTHAPVRRGALRILQVVTAFTVGHSVTLAAAALGLIHVPAKPIEVLIAVSIFVSAIHAVRPLFPGREGFIAGFFGLIHGLAFAATLGELGLRRWDLVAGVFAFNLGIETLQLIVVAATMPSLMLLSRTPVYRPFRIAGALFASVASLCWIAERLSSKHTPVDLIMNGIAAHAVSAAAMLSVMSLVLWRFRAARGEHAFPFEADQE